MLLKDPYILSNQTITFLPLTLPPLFLQVQVQKIHTIGQVVVVLAAIVRCTAGVLSVILLLDHTLGNNCHCKGVLKVIKEF